MIIFTFSCSVILTTCHQPGSEKSNLKLLAPSAGVAQSKLMAPLSSQLGRRGDDKVGCAAAAAAA
jgi:hypothetical protein